MNLGLITLTISLILVIIFLRYLVVKRRELKSTDNVKMLYNEFIVSFILLIIHIGGLILQILFSKTSIEPIYFDYITYISGVTLPVMFMFIALTFENKDIKKYLWLLIVPAISLLVLWTNSFHHLFYEEYSINIEQAKFGIYFYIYTIYSYGLIFLAMIKLIRTSIRRSGFFSLQTAFIILGDIVPILPNVLGTLKIISIDIYVTPVLFIVTTICYSIAIIKYKALNITPIAFKTVINTMSDAYIVISIDGTIVDMNLTFEKKFMNILKFEKGDNFFDVIDKSTAIDEIEIKSWIAQSRKSGEILTKEYHLKHENYDKYYEVDIHPISARDNSKDYVGSLFLFKDITQHKIDMMELQEKQDIIVKQGQLVSIGELAGGVAHDINTPISAIKTGILMLNTMGGSRTEEEKEILQRMDNCATKIINIVNSMRNQIRNLGGTTNVKFKITDVVNDIKVITYHEVYKNKSSVEVEILDDVSIKGDPTKLGQVLTNLVVNAAQAYDDKGGKIILRVGKFKNNIAYIDVIDFAGGIDESIAPFVFKNILTTKGTNGTGLGLYLAYSVIKGEFNGEIEFVTKKGEGTTFHIRIPVAD